MERIKMIDRHYVGTFRLLDYQRIHSQLLFRCSNFIDDKNINVDLKFETVEYFELPYDLNDLYICNGTDEDWLYIKGRHNGIIYDTSRQLQCLFKIISENKTFFILAGSLLIDTNTLLPEESSIIVNKS